jgi:uncharacterized protein YggE
MTTHPESYIEVTGTATALETVRELYAEIEVEVRAAPKGGAGSTARELRNTVVRELRAAGMRDDELIEGGERLSRSWWRRKHEREASHTIVLKCEDYVRMVRAIAALEPLATDKRTNIDVRMGPKFEGSEASKSEARAAALRAARAKAEGLAAEAGVRIASVMRIEELDGYARSSRYDAPGDALFSMSREIEHEELSSPTREVQYAVRVRFAIAPTKDRE